MAMTWRVSFAQARVLAITSLSYVQPRYRGGASRRRKRGEGGMGLFPEPAAVYAPEAAAFILWSYGGILNRV